MEKTKFVKMAKGPRADWDKYVAAVDHDQAASDVTSVAEAVRATKSEKVSNRLLEMLLDLVHCVARQSIMRMLDCHMRFASNILRESCKKASLPKK